MMTQTQTRASPAVGKDPPMTANIPKDLHVLINQAIPDPQKALDFYVALDRLISEKKRDGESEFCEEYLSETRLILLEMVAQHNTKKSRARFTVVATYLVPALVTILARIITDHFPFG